MLKKIYLYLLILGFVLTYVSAFAQISYKPLTFKAWKEREILEAQNNLTRCANKLVVLKSDKYKSASVTADKKEAVSQEQIEAVLGSKGSAKGKKTSSEVGLAEEQLNIANENLQIAKELTLEDYIAVYLGQYLSEDKAIREVLSSMNDDEVFDLVKAALKSTYGDKTFKPEAKLIIKNWPENPTTKANAL